MLVFVAAAGDGGMGEGPAKTAKRPGLNWVGDSCCGKGRAAANIADDVEVALDPRTEQTVSTG